MRLTTVEFIILQITFERKVVSGYEIDQWIKEWGYREWADIGTTSIYTGLAKLGKKWLVSSYLDTAKYGRGPLPRKFLITDAGRKVLKQEILAALSSTRERDYRFDLAFAAIPAVATEEVVAALEQRKTFLREVAERVNRLFEEQGGQALPFNLQALFKHPLLYIQSEIAFVDRLIQEL
jgi:DNA-binding PadR family transcriptional regulator